jgi:hypothetical protein
MEIQRKWQGEVQDARTVKLRYVPTTEQIADGFTKPLARDRFEWFRNGLGIEWYSHGTTNEKRHRACRHPFLSFYYGVLEVLMGPNNRDEWSLTFFMTKEISEWECWISRSLRWSRGLGSRAYIYNCLPAYLYVIKKNNIQLTPINNMNTKASLINQQQKPAHGFAD